MPRGVAQRAEVLRTERITPHMVRIYFTAPGGGPLKTSPAGKTDAYVKVLLPRPGSGVSEPFTLEEVKEQLPPEKWPVMRTYTIRSFDEESGQAALDFVVHGDEGIAGPWADSAGAGDQVQFYGPGGGYAPDPEADWHFLAGDEAVLPAISTALEAMPAGARAFAFIEVASRAEVQQIETAANASIHWIYRDESTAAPGEDLIEAVTSLDFPAGRVQAFVHGDALTVKQLRSFLRFEKNIPREDLSISGYWRRGNNDEQWRAAKKQWKREVEAEESQHSAA